MENVRLENKRLLKRFLTQKEEFLHQRKKRNSIGLPSENMLAQRCNASATTLLEQLIQFVHFTTLQRLTLDICYSSIIVI